MTQLKRCVTLALAIALVLPFTWSVRAQNAAPDKAGPFFAQPNNFTYGYVAGVAATLMNEAPDPHALGVPKSYRQCLVGQTPISMTKVTQSYLGQHPESNTYSPDVVVIQALQEMCAPFRPSLHPK